MIERLLFASRWLLLPFYLGLILALLLLVAKFLQKLAGVLPDFLDLDLETTIVASLKLVDITLTGNLVLMMILAGYENFISRIRTDTTDERPSWMGKIGFGALKMKLIASIVAISAIQLLETFMGIASMNKQDVAWQIVSDATVAPLSRSGAPGRAEFFVI